MKKFVLISLLCIFSICCQSQVVFNRIIADTVNHITNSVYANDTGYICLSGTRNEYGIRSFAITSLNSLGIKNWKKIYGDNEVEFWEGRKNCLKHSDNTIYSIMSSSNTTEGEMGINICLFDSIYNLVSMLNLYSGTDWKKGFNIIKSNDDYFYVSGMIYDADLDDAFMYLIKIDSIGNVIWDKFYGLRNESGDHLIETSDKNILVGGATFSFPTTVTDEDWYLIKLDTAGNVIWQNGFGRPGFLNYDGAVAGLIETRDSNYVACGGYPALRSDTDTYWDGCLRKVSKDGVLMWERFYRTFSRYTLGNTTMYEYFNSLFEDNIGNIWVVSSTFGAKPFYRGSLTKLTSNGDILFKRFYYAIDIYSNEQYLTVLQPTNDGGVILAGYGNSYDWYGYDPPQQAWLVKTDSLGIDGLCYTEPPAINIDIVLPATVNCSDTITVYAYISGKSAPYSIETSIGQLIDSIYYPPLFVPIEIGLSQAEIQYGGEIIYTQQITEATLSNHEWGQCIAKPVEFYTPHTSGSQQINITVTDAYGESKTITKEVLVNDNCGSGIGGEEVNSVNVYPNPAVDNLYLDLPDTIFPVNCEIYNSVGQLVKTLQLSNNLTVINVKDFASGIYVLKINSESKTYSLSFEKL